MKRAERTYRAIGAAGGWLVVVSLALAGLGCAGPGAGGPQAGDQAIAQLDGSSDLVFAVPVSVAITDLGALERDAEAVLRDVRPDRSGQVYSGAVEGTNADDFAIAVALVDGRGFSVGRGETRFPLMSVSKPFSYALAVEQRGAAFMIEKIGVNPTGLPYNAVAAGAVRRTSEQNPLVNAGAIATHSYIEGSSPAAKTEAICDLYSRMAAAPLHVEESWRAVPRALTYTLAYQMKSAGRLEGDVDDVTNRYLEACIVGVTAEELAQMGATLAGGGVQPRTGEKVLKRETVRTVLSVMVTAGMYEDSGLWWTEVGLPAKSGVSGAILAVVPGWGAIVAYSPRLDDAGNSVRAASAIEQLSSRWGLHSIDRLLSGAPPRRPAIAEPALEEAAP